MFSDCSVHTLLGQMCLVVAEAQDFMSWLDQRINLNEGVVATVLALIGTGMQNFEGARRIAGVGIILVALAIFSVAVFEGPERTLRGKHPFTVQVPSLFHNVHGDVGNRIASDELGRNSVQLVSGDLTIDTPESYLARHCIPDTQALAKRVAEDNEIDNVNTLVFSFLPSNGADHWCFYSWHEQGQPLDHYEVYIAIPADEGTKGKFARMHLRAEKPSHALITDDYRTMRNSLLKSAGLTPPK